MHRRRGFLKLSGVLPAALMLPAWSLSTAARAEELPATPPCADADEPTPRQMEGPFFKPRSPRRSSLLEPSMKGTKLVLTGLVLSTRCQPIAGALLDFWQCDDAGEYDNSGFQLRGHQFSDAAGGYRLDTIVPAIYPGRTRHIHVKVQAPNRPVLTTQVYFPGVHENQHDFLFRRELLMALRDDGGIKAGRFDFRLRIA